MKKQEAVAQVNENPPRDPKSRQRQSHDDMQNSCDADGLKEDGRRLVDATISATSAISRFALCGDAKTRQKAGQELISLAKAFEQWRSNAQSALRG